jgi:hypothetical protein
VVAFNTLSDQPDIYQMREQPAPARKVAKRAVLVAIPPLPGRKWSGAEQLLAQAELDRKHPRYREAEAVLTGALEMQGQADGKASPVAALIMGRLGRIRHALGQYREAERLLLEATATLEKTRGASHPDTLASTIDLAGVYKDLGENLFAVFPFMAPTSQELEPPAIPERFGARRAASLTSSIVPANQMSYICNTFDAI